MSEYQDLDKVIRQTEEAITAIKVAIAQHNSIPNQKAQLDYIAAAKEAEKWRQLFEQAQKNGDINQLHYARERLRIHEDNAEKAKQRININSAEVDNLQQKLADLENKLAIAKAQRVALFANIADNPISSIRATIDPQSALLTFERMEKKVLEMKKYSQEQDNLTEGNKQEEIDEIEAMKKQLLGNGQKSKHISILDQAIEETCQTIAKVKQDYQNTLNSLEKNLKALEQAKQSLLKTDEVSPSENEGIDAELNAELEELRRQLESL